MTRLLVATGCVNQLPLDWRHNAARLTACINDARQQGASVLCLPELSITGYGCEDTFLGCGVVEQAWSVLQELAPLTQGMFVGVGLPVRHQGILYNAAAALIDGKLEGVVAKQNLAKTGIHYEPRWFEPWPRGRHEILNFAGESVPFGDLIFDLDGVRIGFEICEDAWVDDRPGHALAAAGADVLLNPSASHFAFGKHAERTQLVVSASADFHVAYLYANLLGNEAGRAIYDGGSLIASEGALLAAGERFVFTEHGMVFAHVDTARNRARRPQGKVQPAPQPGSGEGTPKIVRLGASLPEYGADKPEIGHSAAAWESSSELKEEEFLRAVSLGLFDYLRKSRSRGFVVSLSGGADSAAVACLSHFAIHLAEQSLGADIVAGRLGLAQSSSSLITCAYQATRNSSTLTHDAARGIAEAIGADFLSFDVQPMVDGYRDLIEKAIGHALTWEEHDLTLQNIQARARAPSVWMLANLKGALLLATSNRSEAAVGYATMDGDTCGGLSPIAGIDKAFLRHWLRWLEAGGPVALEISPALRAALHGINSQEPTAELRPQASKQTDEADLMPYEVLDAIEKAAIRDKLTPQGCLDVVRQRWPDRHPEQLRDHVVRFFRLWSRNQWKRERYAPSFHLDDENLDPKTWCRFPILSAGFEHELAAIENGPLRAS